MEQFSRNTRTYTKISPQNTSKWHPAEGEMLGTGIIPRTFVKKINVKHFNGFQEKEELKTSSDTL